MKRASSPPLKSTTTRGLHPSFAGDGLASPLSKTIGRTATRLHCCTTRTSSHYKSRMTTQWIRNLKNWRLANKNWSEPDHGIDDLGLHAHLHLYQPRPACLPSSSRRSQMPEPPSAANRPTPLQRHHSSPPRPLSLSITASHEKESRASPNTAGGPAPPDARNPNEDTIRNRRRQC
jgi:hypothetical protein